AYGLGVITVMVPQLGQGFESRYMIGKLLQELTRCFLRLRTLFLSLVVLKERFVRFKLIRNQLQAALEASLGGRSQRPRKGRVMAEEWGQPGDLILIGNAGGVLSHAEPDHGSRASRLIAGPGHGVSRHRL